MGKMTKKKKAKKKRNILQVSVSSKNNMSMPKSFIVEIVEGIKEIFTRT